MTRTTRIVAAIAVVVLAVAAVSWFVRRDDGHTAQDAGPADGAGRSELTVLSVTGAPHALLAVVGTHPERPPAALVLPPGVTVVAPGQGETSTEGVAALPGPSMRVAVSNAVGAWTSHYGVLGLDALGAAVDRAGGLTVDLLEPVELDGSTVGPGETELAGADVVAYLAEPSDDATERWAAVLEPLLASGAVGADDLAGSDDTAATAEALGAARGALVEVAPTEPVAATASILDQPAADELARELFGGRPPMPVVVQNGNGEPNVGEVVAERLLPAGFRVVLSQNADSFRHRRTQIAATDDDVTDEAERVRQLLGVGRVVLSQVPSGLADITIVVGRDFTA